MCARIYKRGLYILFYYLLKNIRNGNNNNNNNHLTAPEEMSTWQERPGSYPTDCRRVPWKIHTRFLIRVTYARYFILLLYIIYCII